MLHPYLDCFFISLGTLALVLILHRLLGWAISVRERLASLPQLKWELEHAKGNANTREVWYHTAVKERDEAQKEVDVLKLETFQTRGKLEQAEVRETALEAEKKLLRARCNEYAHVNELDQLEIAALKKQLAAARKFQRKN